jgi:hypothetical protein
MYIDRGLQKKLGKTGGNGTERVLAVPGSERKGRAPSSAINSGHVTDETAADSGAVAVADVAVLRG